MTEVWGDKTENGETRGMRWRLLLAYGAGSFGGAFKTAPISAFLLIYYNQVLGLPAFTASVALTATLALDALCDPLVGQMSDTWRSRIGRRLPFMYLAPLPLALAFIWLWNPPAGLSAAALTAHLLIALSLVRMLDTLFELPHLAIVPEIARDYNERTRIYTWRYLFEAAGGVVVTMLAYNVFLKENPDGGGGVLASGGYAPLSVVCACVMAVSMLVCAVGLQASGRLGSSRDLPAMESLQRRFFLFAATLNSAPVIRLSLVAMLISIGSGLSNSLSMYWLLYYYRFSQAEMSLLVVTIMLGIALTAMTPRIAARLGKRGAAVLFCWTYVAATAAPLAARMFDLAPASSAALLAMVAAQGVVGTATMTMTMIVLTSMVSDLTEEAQGRTGRRSEATLLSGLNFIRKATHGFGALAAGAILAIVAFPTGAERDAVAATQMDDLALYYLGGKAALFTLVTVLLLTYRYDAAAEQRG